MANFKTHITTSTLLGIGYGAVAYTQFGVPADQCVLAAGLCSVSGMLPDLDADTGVPLRESLCFAAAIVPMLMLERFKAWGMSTDSIVLAAAGIYVFIRFVLGKLLKMYTVHRGMFHSIPAAIICAEVAFLICDSDDINRRLFKASAVTIGFVSHLLLDEINSIDLYKLRIKKSFGTALKLFSKKLWPNISTYGKLAILTWLVIQDPIWMHRTGERANEPMRAGSEQDENPSTGDGFFDNVFRRTSDSGEPSMAENGEATRR